MAGRTEQPPGLQRLGLGLLQRVPKVDIWGLLFPRRSFNQGYSKTQANIALSSAEAKHYSMVKAASEGLGLKAMTMDYHKPLSPWMFVDSTAAIGVAQRVGLSKLRHLETQSLWLQEAVRDKRIGLSKLHGPVNLADLMTKHVDHATQI